LVITLLCWPHSASPFGAVASRPRCVNC